MYSPTDAAPQFVTKLTPLIQNMDDDTNDIADTGSKSTISVDFRDNSKPDGLAFITCPEAYSESLLRRLCLPRGRGI